jgi:hypothetical protein
LPLDGYVFGVIVNYNTTSSTADEAVMNAPLTRTLLLAISVAATGATLMAMLSGSPVPALGQAVVAAPLAPAIDEAIVTLPLVRVVPEVAPTLLATVTVRPDEAADGGDEVELAAVADYPAGAAGGGTGMPYYSFGKSMHRAYWE